jgi:peptide/nickel transport system substrate-binding protein
MKMGGLDMHRDKLHLGPYSHTAIDRRDFLISAASLGLSMPVVISTAIPSRAAGPKKGGRFRYGSSQGSTTDTMDPATMTNDFMTAMSYSTNTFLTQVDSEGNLVGDLAESYEAKPGADEWLFRIRKGAEFHDGKPLTIEDIIATMNYHADEKSKSSVKAQVSAISEMRKDGENGVIFKLKEGNAGFPWLLSGYQLAILQATDGKIASSSYAPGAGAGPYVAKSFNPGVAARLERNPNFYRDGVAHFDSAEFLVIADPAARMNAIVAGDVHMVDRVDLKAVHNITANPKLELLDIAGTLHYTFAMRTDTPPFDNNDVRLALKSSIDREEILKKILFGHGVLGNDHPIGKPNRYYAAELPQRTYDPELAKSHLKKAGLTTLSVDLSAADAAFPGAVDAAVLYKDQAAKAGININVVREPNDGYWSNVWMKKPWSVSFWSGRPTEDWMFTEAYSAGANWNETFWKNERFNALLKQARAELDETKRREMYVEMQRLCRDEGGAVIPMFGNHVMAISRSVAHPPKVAGNWNLDGGKFMERWWFT